MKYSVIAPAYNEEGNVGPLVARLTEAMEKAQGDYEIIIVDDGSTDDTLATLKLLQKRYPNLTVIVLEANSGQTVAYQVGFDHARGGRIVTLDSDLEKDPAYIPQMIKKLDDDNLDVVYFRKLYKNIPFIRKFASAVANRFRRAVTGDKARDVGSTLVVYRENFFKGRNYCSGFHRFFLGFLEVEGKKMDYVEGDVFNRPTGETKYTTWGRLKQGLADLYYYYLYKTGKTGPGGFMIGLAVLALIILIAPLALSLQVAALGAIALVYALIVSLNRHVCHLLVLQKRPPYRIKEYLPGASAKAADER